MARTAPSADRWIPWTFAGALGVVVAVNGAFAYFASVSSTGLVTEHPFDEGNGYNRILDAGAAQDALGWHVALSFAAQGKRRGEIAASFSDRAGAPVTQLAVRAQIVRPVEPLPPLALTLAETGAGRYAATAAFDRPGQWEVRVAARRGSELYDFAQRIVVP
jgi:nitrogen fixation protein FixH